jgi:hypothetical protein
MLGFLPGIQKTMENNGKHRKPQKFKPLEMKT